jgi:hypothetical protein
MGKPTKPRLVADAEASTETPEPERAPAADPAAIDIEITEFTKASGTLSKRIQLVNRKPVSDGSECRMAHGTARRVKLTSPQAVADLMNGFTARQALSLGRLKGGLPERVDVVVKRELNGAAGVIARSLEFLEFRKGEQSLCLLDVDIKGLPNDIEHRIKESSVWGVLTTALPALKGVGRVERPSTSSCLRNRETDEVFEGSGGQHIFVVVRDGADIPRFIRDLHDRLWLESLGFGMVSRAGSFLARSLIDASVGAPERLGFRGTADRRFAARAGSGGSESHPVRGRRPRHVDMRAAADQSTEGRRQEAQGSRAGSPGAGNGEGAGGVDYRPCQAADRPRHARGRGAGAGRAHARR